MSDNSESELGRSKHSATPSEHLKHLLTIGWSTSSPLILKYVLQHGLQRELSEWQALNRDLPQPVKSKK